jgi:alpha-galactosidase
MRVSAPLLLDTADAFTTTGLLDDGYRYIIATEGWNLANRTAVTGELQPAPSFTNSSLRALSDQLHAQGFKFGIYGAAAFTTCGHRAGSLYHERQDARWYKEHGVDYLKYVRLVTLEGPIVPSSKTSPLCVALFCSLLPLFRWGC